MNPASRLSTGVTGLDACLGGGLIPGTLTIVVGASGIGKTQLGLQFAHAGTLEEGRRGLIFDCSARVDPQSHAAYAERMFGWQLAAHPQERFSPEGYFEATRAVGDYLHVFDHQGRRVTQSELGFDAWHDWQAELAAKLERTIDFFYANFVRGARRVVIDGIEPARRPSESIQFELVEYIYHQVLRKESDWVARDLFRQSFRAHAEAVERHAYDHGQVGAVLLLTAHETLLDDLIARPLADGDPLAVANTLIYMGKIRDGDRFARGLAIAKHRGSACSDEIIRYRIDDGGIRLD
jgi:KaiC/GvpD/RAD55 family RecA-like ATPase